MIYLYSGKDTYQSYKTAKEHLESLSKKNGLSAKILNCDDITDPNVLVQEVEGVGMFESASVLLCKRLLENKKLSALLESEFDKFSAFEILIWHPANADGKLKIVQKIKSKGVLLDFPEVKEWEFKTWVQKRIKERKINMSTSQVEYFLSHMEFDKWWVENELDKITAFLEINEGKITDHDLAVLLGFDAKGDIWKFLDEFGARNKKGLLNEFLKLTKFEDNVQYLIAMLSRELRILMQILDARERGIDPSSIGINSYVLQKSSVKAKNFKKQEIKNLTQKLFEMDYAIKSGKVDDITAMTMYLSVV